MDPREKNHKASTGANMKPTLPVPNCCMLNNATSIKIEMITTAPVNENVQIIGYAVQMLILVVIHVYTLATQKEKVSIGLLEMQILISLKTVPCKAERLIGFFRVSSITQNCH